MSCGIVLEGGGMRGIFTSGILDVLMEKGIRFDALAGVSAGVLFGCNYKSLQPGRGLRYNILFKDDKRYMSWQSLWEATDEAMDWFRASASMPIFAKPVELEGHVLLDGGISDSIPLQFLQDKGYDKNLVVLTRPKGYRKKPSHGIPLIRLFTRKYPKVAALMRTRHRRYNEEVEYIEQQAETGNTFVLYPEYPLNIGRIEQNEQKMIAIYNHGREVALKHLSELKKFLEN